MNKDSSSQQVTINSEIARNAIKQYDFNSVKLKFLKHLENTTFKLSTEQGNFLLRVYCGLQNTVQDIESEAKIIEYLSNCNNSQYQKPIYNNSHNFVSMVEASGIAKPVSILSWIDSPIIGNQVNDLSLFEQLGKLVAHIHNQLANWQKPINFKRPMFDADGLIGSNGAFGYANLGYKYFDNQTVSLFESVYQRLIDFEAVNGKQKNIFGIIHGDLHLNNVILHQNTLIPIDFDDSGWGYYIYDLAVILAKYSEMAEYSKIKTSLIKGYRSIKELSIEIENKLSLFMAARYICLALFLAGKSEEESIKQTALEYIPSYVAKLKDIIAYV
ncbi:phosphotransferase enzyme family protein [Calothrix sp. CCY 0018]|uniref:phosphotransferase enzyme family protein n=1 Tax=Calothrix sp. CCY 0018 TaxID=3103864 RepID=UPI0039C6100C